MSVTHFAGSKIDARGFILNGEEFSVKCGTATISGTGPVEIDTGLSQVKAAVAAFNGTPTGTTLPGRLEVEVVSGGTIRVTAEGASDDASTPIFWIAVGVA